MFSTRRDVCCDTEFCCLQFISDFFFFNAPATTEIYTLSLHDALPISGGELARCLPRSFSGRDPQAGFPHIQVLAAGTAAELVRCGELAGRFMTVDDDLDFGSRHKLRDGYH